MLLCCGRVSLLTLTLDRIECIRKRRDHDGARRKLLCFVRPSILTVIIGLENVSVVQDKLIGLNDDFGCLIASFRIQPYFCSLSLMWNPMK
jgi:hypothetical protein